jgi:hypothetical protein
VTSSDSTLRFEGAVIALQDSPLRHDGGSLFIECTGTTPYRGDPSFGDNIAYHAK